MLQLNEEFVNRVLKVYDEDTRRVYHTSQHIVNMLEGVDYHIQKHNSDALDRGCKLIGSRWQRRAEAAVLFHDIVYEVGSVDNERRSAHKAELALINAGWSNEDIAHVMGLIMTTVPFSKRPDPANYTSEYMFLVDLIHDLNWIGFSSYVLCKDNENRILQEALNHGVPLDVARGGQYAFYSKLLKYLEDRSDGMFSVIDVDAEEVKSIVANLKDELENTQTNGIG